MSDHRSNTAANPPIDSGNFLIEASRIMDGTLLRGDTIAITDRRGDVVALRRYGQNATYGQFEYSPFGQQIKSTGNVSLTDYPYRFAGQENEGNDLYNMRNRYYAPDWGRFFSEDPIGLLGGTNLYAYSFNNPVTFSDPSGLLAVGWDADHPWLDFTLQGTSVGLQTGLAASATAFSFGMYDGGSFKCQPGFGTSVVLATISREAAIQAATLGATNALEGAGAVSAASKFCFTGDTLILMADGSSKPISEIQFDDLVLTKSDATGLVEAKAVTRVFSHQESSTLKLTFSDGSVLRTTPEHPFWVNGQGWIPAGRLAIGNCIVTIVTRAGPQTPEKTVVVAKSNTVRGRARVYNFTVDDSHTYFVQDANGKGDAKWVHNGCRISPVAADWAEKGAHIVSDGIELAVRPGMNGSVVLKPFFSGQSAQAVERAISGAQTTLRDPIFRSKLISRVRGAVPYVLQYPNSGGVGRSFELNVLLKALTRF